MGAQQNRNIVTLFNGLWPRCSSVLNRNRLASDIEGKSHKASNAIILTQKIIGNGHCDHPFSFQIFRFVKMFIFWIYNEHQDVK